MFVKKESGGRTVVGTVPAPLLAAAAKSRFDFLDPKIPSFATNSIVRLAYNKGSVQIELEKDDKPNAEFPLGKWAWTKPDGLKGKTADAMKVRALLAVAATLSPGKVVAENPTEADWKRFGLDPKAGPRLKVAVTPKAEKELVYEFGTETADKAYVYARHTDGTLVYTIPRVVYDRFQTEDLAAEYAVPKREVAPAPRPHK